MRPMGGCSALRLERYFDSESQGWLALQAAYDLRIDLTNVVVLDEKLIK
jgi:plasmid maintenance system antidote protein VapI